MHARTAKCVISLVVLLYLSVSHSNLLRAQSWVQGVGKVIIAEHMTTAEAKQIARSRARLDAIEKALGVDVSAGQFLQQFEVLRNSGEVLEAGESFAKFIHESRRGRIMKEMTWQEKDTVLVYSGNITMIQRIARNSFYVVAEGKKADANFELELSLAKRDYREGEALSFEVTSTLDCYLNIFNLAGNDTVYLMFPNTIEKSNRLLSMHQRTIPGANYSFRTALPEGKKITVEYLIAVASKDSLVFRAKEKVRPGLGYAETWKAGMVAVLKWISNIDPDRRVEAIESFKIIGN